MNLYIEAQKHHREWQEEMDRQIASIGSPNDELEPQELAVDLKSASDEKAEPDKYVFPAHLSEQLTSFVNVSTESILSKLHACEVPYRDLGREKFSILCLALIDRRIAPGLLRLRSGVTQPSGLPTEQKNESNDRQVLDLYWLYRHRRNLVSPRKKELKKLFGDVTFNFALASEIVATMGTPSYKAAQLVLSEELQLELLMLQTPGAKAIVKAHQRRRDQLEMALRSRALVSRSKLNQDSIPEYLDAFTVLDLGAGSPVRSAELWSMMTGEEASPRLVERLRSKRRRLEEMTGVTCRKVDSKKIGQIMEFTDALVEVERARKKQSGSVGARLRGR